MAHVCHVATDRGLGGRRPAGGFTLVELLVAVVVLMIGIYAMMRIFPGGFSAIEAGHHRTVAAQLAEAELARWRLDPDTLPDAIVATDYQGRLVGVTLVNTVDNLPQLHVWGELAAATGGMTYSHVALDSEQLRRLKEIAWPLIYSPNDLTPSQFNAAIGEYREPPGAREATPHPTWQPNSMFLPRTVIGERLDIRRLSQTVAGVPFYLLAHAPLDALRKGVEPLSGVEWREYVDVYDARAWQYVPGADWTADLGARQFTIDAATGHLYVGPSVDPPALVRRFKVDYTDPATRQRVFGLTLEVAAGSVGPGVPAGDHPWPVVGLDGRTVAVHERLILLTEEEYEQYRPDTLTGQPLLWPRNAYYVDPETLISGRIMFSPQLQLDPLPTDITQVKVDYRVQDWQILAFDVSVPPDGVVQLPVRPLKGPDYTNLPRQPQPQEVARAIKRFYHGPGAVQPRPDPRVMWAYVVAVDRQTGEILTDHEGMSWPTNPRERLERFRVNYRDGMLFFNYGEWEVEPTFNHDLEANHWVGGPGDAKAMHSRSGRSYRIFCRAQGDWAVQLMPAARRYARSSEPRPGGPPVAGGNGELVTYAWSAEDRRQLYFPLSEAGQVVAVDYYDDNDTYIAGEVRRIDHRPVLLGGAAWVCQLAEPLDYRPNDWGPIAVRGISARVRVAWVAPGRTPTLQDLVEALADPQRRYATPSLNERWQAETITTYLTRTPL